MGIEIGAQLDALWRSLFLGAAFALLYDGLRALRLRRRTRRALTDLLDALYCLFLAAALLAFTLRIGQGELRLYMLAFIALGAYLSFALLSPLLRPLWDFWADCLFAFARLLRAPLLLVKKYYGKLQTAQICQKALSFFAPHPYNRKLQTVGAAFPARRGTKGRCAVWQRKRPRAKSRAAERSRSCCFSLFCFSSARTF